MPIKKLRYDKITTNDGTQIRAEISDIIVSEYRERMKAGDKFPPMDVFSDGDKNWLADGFHRFHAGHASGLPASVDCEIHKGGRLDAIKFALSANATHGARRTNADKQNSVKVAFKEFGFEKSNGIIADLCAVSAPMVKVIREEVQPKKSSSSIPAPRIGKDGKTRKLPPPVIAKKKTAVESPLEVHIAEKGECDKTELEIPPEILDQWNDAGELSVVLNELVGVRRKIRSVASTNQPAMEVSAKLFPEINFTVVDASLTQAIADLERGIPYAVCPTCQGIKFKKCPDCKGRGFVSEFFWNTCVPEEKKAMRAK